MKILTTSIISLLFLTSSLFSDAKSRKVVADHLQNISVTIKSEARYSKSEGSGVLVNRKIEGENITFVWTAGHVIDNLRTIREVVDRKGNTRKLVEFSDARIVKELVEDGRRVGEIKMDASVIKYSDAENGHDLALLMVRAKDYGKDSTKFLLKTEDTDDKIVPIGTRLYHVGSLLGQVGSNSMTTGIVSQVGRVLGDIARGAEFDQTTVTAFPGSSGGGVFLENGEYVGMIVRGAGEGFNFMVPIRRMQDWADENGLSWALDPSAKAPTFDEIKKIPVEGLAGEEADKEGDEESFSVEDPRFPFLIKVTKK
ncbi:hypothetical protein CMO96_02045 [Candidatus Woesebacteria bacterium]|nr:hypothetical protein [Candidatus Woesebacteria bacterium]